jgi:hypothetical protein
MEISFQRIANILLLHQLATGSCDFPNGKSNEQAYAETKSFRLSGRLVVDITVGPAGLVCEWEPSAPRKLTRLEKQAYTKARDEMLARPSEMIGGRVAIIRVGGKLSVIG